VRRGGVGDALVVALALITGAAIGDVFVVVVGGVSLRRAAERFTRWVRYALASVLAGLAIWLLVTGVIGA
jgi:threonine/homoserine/homoserine lactone efflux protein